MSVPKGIILYEPETSDLLIVPCKQLILNGKSQIEQNLQQVHMKEFLDLTLKILLNSIINLKFEIPPINKFYEIYLESIKQFLGYIDKKFLNYDNLGIELLKQKLAQVQNPENIYDRLCSQIINNSDYIVNALSKRFSIEEIHAITFCLLQRECKEINESLKKLKQTIISRRTKTYTAIDGTVHNYIDVKFAEHEASLNFF
ncbi:hypothetical protein MSI_26930 [Treponema sp. JC4]|nr:hypothetical protein MSI_26930 [Treponema sp. JC4]